MEEKFTPDGVLNEARRVARESREHAQPKASSSRPATRRAAPPPAEVVPPPRRYVYGTMPSLRYWPAFLKIFLGAIGAWFVAMALLTVFALSGAVWFLYVWFHTSGAHAVRF